MTTILLVEDDEMNKDMLSRRLMKRDMRLFLQWMAKKQLTWLKVKNLM